MYALVVFKRNMTHPTEPPHCQLGFEVRQFGCFNGFNMTDAFTVNRTQEGFDLIVDTNTTGAPFVELGVIQRAYPRGFHGQEREAHVGWSASAWECLGIGWLCHTIGGAQNKTRADVAPVNTPGANKCSPSVGVLLGRESYHATYYDGNTGDMRRTIRELTPNEQFLSNFGHFSQRSTAYFSDAHCRTSRVALAYSTTIMYQNCNHAFVGSERNSGQAVSYLQAFRNAAEQNIAGWAMKQGTFDFLARVVPQFMGHTRSVIALLSYFTNGGSDSDNITFAGTAYGSYCLRVGFWKTAELYRDTSSMLVEGRYNKGGQSDSIDRKLRALIRSRGVQAQFNPDTTGLNIMDINGGLTVAQSLVQYGTTARINQYRGQAERLVTEYRNLIDRYFATDVGNTLNRYCAQALALPDLTYVPPPAPRLPTTRADGAAMTFVQWVTHTEEAIQEA